MSTDEKPKKAVKDMSEAEFRAACAEFNRPRFRTLDTDGLSKIAKGRKATELSDEEYAASMRIIKQAGGYV